MSERVIDQRFVLLTEYKRGGIGTVWKARDLSNQQLVALKLLHDTGSEQAQRFVREAALLSELDDPGIVRYVAHGTSDGDTPYLCMEWLEGENLAERLARRSLGLRESLQVIESALRGLHAAHSRGLTHRDLKPSNMFLRSGRLGDVVLLDLGMARFAAESRQLTRSGTILGTPSYMAPEQATGERGAQAALDVFALGCVWFECLTGAPPFAAPHMVSVLAKLLFEQPPRLRELRPELPEELERLLEQMLAKDPARRLRDAAAVRLELRALAELADVPPQTSAGAPPAVGGGEQELVSVILTRSLAAGSSGGSATLAAPAGFPDVAAYGGEWKRLADGTELIVLGQRSGAATDLCARAARCALRLCELRPELACVVATGRGIASGRSYLGEAVERAAIMQREQREAAIWLDEVTAGLLDARFRTRRLSEGIVVFALEGEDPSIDPARRLLGKPTACVGRDHELGMLSLGLRSCVEDASPRAILVVGPPGIGKSRLRHEFMRRNAAEPESGLVLTALGDPIRSAASRGMLATALVRAAGVSEGQPALDQAAQLRARLGMRLGAAAARSSMFLGELCGLRDPAEDTPELRAARQTPNLMNDAIAQAWLAFLRAEAAVGPVLIVLDDLQWADALTVSLVGAALRELRDSPLFVLALGRPETLELYPELWAPRLATLPLPPLSAGATRRLIGQVLGDQLHGDSVERIVHRAGGNALYLEELLRAAEARRDAVPQTVMAMLQARIGLLPSQLRRVLRAASVLGEYFPLLGVRALLSPDDDLDPALSSLSRYEILEPHGDDRSGPRWRFRHALMRDAAYELMTAGDQTSWHAAAARFCEQSGEDAAVIASHYERAGDRPAAIRHYIEAAEQAYRHNALASVVALVARALACGAEGEARGVLRAIEIPARFYQNEFAPGWQACSEALALLPPGHTKRIQSLAYTTFVASQLGKPADAWLEELLAARPAAADSGAYVVALGYASISHVVTGNRPQAQRLLARLAEVAAAVSSEEDAFLRGHALYWQLRYEELLGDDPCLPYRMAQEGVVCYEAAGDRRMLACTQVEVGECARRIGVRDDIEPWLRRAVALVEQIGEAVPTAFVTQYLANYLAHEGSADEAKQLAQRCIELSGPGVTYRAFAQVALAAACLCLSELEAAEESARAAHSGLRTIGLRGYYPLTDAKLIEVLLAAGKSAEAADIADQAQQLLAANGPLGTLELPLRLWIVRAQRAAGRDTEAATSLTSARDALSRRAARIADPVARERFLREVPEHAQLLTE
ncbi:MAG TPA: protein kinase [Polyangiales bacterium]|nr:protein kinase [Polyangiales bacterium]